MSLRYHNMVLERTAQSGGALATMLVLAHYADGEGLAWPSVATLAAMCRVGERAMYKTLAALEGAGEIAPVGRGKRGVVIYQLFPQAGEPQPLNQGSGQGGGGAVDNSPVPEPGFRGDCGQRCGQNVDNNAQPLNAGSGVNAGSVECFDATPEPAFTQSFYKLRNKKTRAREADLSTGDEATGDENPSKPSPSTGRRRTHPDSRAPPGQDGGAE